MNVLISYFVGMFAAIIASIPVGPITFAIIQATLNRGKLAGFMIAFGAIFVEIFFCVVAVFGLGSLINSDTILEVLHVVSIPVLILLGFISLFKKEKEFSHDTPSVKASNFLLLGATLCFTNPIIVGYWVLITANLKQRGWLHDEFMEKTVFIAGIVTGVILFFTAVIQVTDWKKQSISLRVRNQINIGLGIFFIAFGVYLGIRYLMGILGDGA